MGVRQIRIISLNCGVFVLLKGEDLGSVRFLSNERVPKSHEKEQGPIVQVFCLSACFLREPKNVKQILSFELLGNRPIKLHIKHKQ